MAVLKIKNDQGVWEEVLTLNGRDGAIQYVAGPNIRIDGNVISATNSEGTVTREDVEAMIAAIPLPTKVSDLTNDSGFLTEETEPAFNASDAKGITAAQILAWTAKQDSIVFNTTYNPTSNKAATMADIPVVPTVPTKLSAFTNDTGFITSSDIPSIPTKLSDLTNDSGFITSSDIPTIPTKLSDLTNDSGFITSSDIPTIPTKLSDLLNDRGYITQSSVPTQVSDLLNDAGYITNTYHDNTKQNTLTAGNNININGNTISATVPTKVSDLTNDSGFITDEDIPTNTSDLINDNYALITTSGSSYSFTNLYAALNKTLVKNGTVDFNQIHAFRLQQYEQSTYNGQAVTHYNKPWSIASIENAATKVYDSRIVEGRLVAGTAGNYDTVIHFKGKVLTYSSGSASYYTFGYNYAALYINKANIVSGTGSTSSFALMAGSSSINVAKG